jgi:hypothetical protein
LADQAYQFSRWIYNIMESFFNWVWSLITSGRLDFFFEHWFIIALLVSAAAFTIDMLLYYLREGRETLAIKFILFVYGLFRKLYYKIAGKEMPTEGDFADGGYDSGEPDTYQRGFYMDTPAFEPSTFEYERYAPPAGGESVPTREDAPAPEEQPDRHVDISYIFPEIMHDEEELTTDKRPSEEPLSNVIEFPAGSNHEETETPTDEQ